MSKKQCKVNNDWLQKKVKLKDGCEVLYKDFLKKKSEFELNCLACDSTINVKSKGQAAVSQHIVSEKHEVNMQTKFGKNQLKIQNNDIRLFVALLV